MRDDPETSGCCPLADGRAGAEYYGGRDAPRPCERVVESTARGRGEPGAACIISYRGAEIGYVQYYRDDPPGTAWTIPRHLAADIFIGERSTAPRAGHAALSA
jgi:hypothetical protein